MRLGASSSAATEPKAGGEWFAFPFPTIFPPLPNQVKFGLASQSGSTTDFQIRLEHGAGELFVEYV
jgi:hypothetical protein